jgi:hypothetical protein
MAFSWTVGLPRTSLSLRVLRISRDCRGIVKGRCCNVALRLVSMSVMRAITQEEA